MPISDMHNMTNLIMFPTAKFSTIVFFSLLICVFSSIALSGEKQKAVTIEHSTAKIKFIYFALMNTYEHHSHNLGSNTNNVVYTKKDGHKEAVFNKTTGKLVTACLNKGSYNYFAAHVFPLKHFAADILPWIKLGNCPNDPSTRKERAIAFSKDFTDGCFRVIKNWASFTKEKQPIIKEKMQKRTMNIFLNILATKGLKKFKFDGTDAWMKDQKTYDKFYALLKKRVVRALGQ